MSDQVAAVRAQIDRQVAHWRLAAERLKLDDLAAPEAWNRLEQYLGVALRRHLQTVVDRLRAQAAVLEQMNRQVRHPGIKQLVATHLPIQKRHLKDVMATSRKLAAQEDANASA